MRKRALVNRVMGARAAVAALTLSAGFSVAGAQSSIYAQAPLPAPHNGALRERFSAVDRILNALTYLDAARYEALWSDSARAPGRLEGADYTRVTSDLLNDPPRLPATLGILAPSLSRSVPEIIATLEWTDVVTRQAYDALAVGTADRVGRIAELMAYYRTRGDLAISAKPKSVDALDAQFYSLAFRRRYPKFNGLIWASRWLELSLYEALVVSETPAERHRMTVAAVQRFQTLLSGSPETAPYLLPLAPVVAPAFTQRYPELAAVLDNKHMLQDVMADILVSREVPASARRLEMIRAGALFRSDTAFAAPYESWLAMRTTIGAQNMGGPAIDLAGGQAQPTVPLGMSLAGMVPRLHAPTPANAVGMQHDMSPDATQSAAAGASMTGMAGGQGMGVIMAVYQRMLQDPVIRERMATDPVIQGLLGSTMGTGTTMGIPGMDMPGMNMPGMHMPPNAAGAPMSEERRQAVEFIVRLLSDPSVASRINADPELRRLWSDPDVQRRLSELRRERPLPAPQLQPRRDVQPASPPAHRH